MEDWRIQCWDWTSGVRIMRSTILLLALLGACNSQDTISENIQKWLRHVEEMPVPQHSPDPDGSKACFGDIEWKQTSVENGILTGITSDGSVLQISTSESDIKSASGNATLTFGDFEIQGYFSRGCLKGLIRFYRIYDLDFVGEDRRMESALIGVSHLKEGGNSLYGGSTWRILRGSLDPHIFAYMIVNGNDLTTSSLPKSLEEFAQLFSGNEVIMLYPDFETAVQGKFHNGDLIEARLVKIREALQNREGLMETVTSKPYGDVYKRDHGTKKKFSIQPFLKDPYEAKNLDILPSSISNAGDGVFTKRFIQNGTAIGYFKGYKLREKDIEPLSMWNILTLSTERSKFLIQYGLNDEYLDVPQEYGKISQYNATTAHKVNHSKKPNAGYFDCNHPRFGEILCLQAYNDIEAHRELFVKYAITVNRDTVDRMVSAGFLASQVYTGKSMGEMKKSIQPYVQMLYDMNKQHPIQDIIEDILGFH